MKIIRLPFDSLDWIDLRQNDPENPDEEGGEESGKEPEPPFLPSPVFSLEEVPLPGRGPAFPEGTVSFDFPADDRPRVAAWFTGNYQGVTKPASSTLTKNMTTAVHSLLADFYKETEAAGLFASPFRLRWRWRLASGSVYQPQAAELIVPASAAPLIAINDYGLGDKSLTTDVIIRQKPSRLLVSIPSLGEQKELVTGIEFFVTTPASLYSKDDAVNGIRSADLDGTRVKIWHYDAPEETANLQNASSDEKFHLLGSIPVASLSSLSSLSSSVITVPVDGAALPDPSGNSSGSLGNENPPVFEPLIYAETPPLDLGTPEEYKRVSALYLRGIFPRKIADGADLVMELFGSLHRENWRLLARSKGPYIRGLGGISCRWFKVRIRLSLRPGDHLAALTFTLQN